MRSYPQVFHRVFLSAFRQSVRLQFLNLLGQLHQPYPILPLFDYPFRREKFLFRKILPYLPKKERSGANLAPLMIIKFTLECQRELYPNLHLKFAHQPKMVPLCLQSLFVIARPLQRTHPLQLLPQGVFWLPPYTR